MALSRPVAVLTLIAALCLPVRARQTPVGGPATDRAVGWQRAREALSKFRATPDLSGLVEVDARISTRVDTEDLAALCQARKDAVVAVQRGESSRCAICRRGTTPSPTSGERPRSGCWVSSPPFAAT